MAQLNSTDAFYDCQPEPNKSCFLALKAIIIQSAAEISETTKYGMPCFCIGKKPILYLWTDKKTGHPYILFVDGRILDYPYLITGNRSRMKTLPVDPNKNIPISLIKKILREVIEYQKAD
ncbi:DUF1801 domain-containing protein [Flavihumibacter sp. UBA7668]|uniref:DUF1801 domain-containing protein n=1 Tax=Flavihumibacter sp. UBA7668 TaxID=1946542 RepID=UPI0039C88188